MGRQGTPSTASQSLVEGDDFHGPLDEQLAAFTKRTVRRIDWRMLPLLGMLYSVALVDRINLAAARSAGMEHDLELNIGDRYSIASMIYFIPYTLLQLPMNLILRRVGARMLLTTCVVGWGIAQLGMAFVTTWGQLSICRVFLGIFEAGFFPSLVFIITCWYQRYEVNSRLSFFYLFSIISASFSNLLAYVLDKLKGKGGLNGWQWIFLVEGIATIFLGILTWFYIADFPDKATFLSEKERQVVLDRIQQDRGDALPDEITREKVLKHMSDPILWAFAFMFMASTVPAYASGFFTTIILQGMHYSRAHALLLTAPTGVFAAISSFFFGWISDRTRHRAGWLIFQYLMCSVGIILATYPKGNGLRYAGMFFMHAGGTGSIPAVLAYASNNITGHTNRAVQSAVMIAFGGIGGILATTVYRQKDYPRYVPGMSATLSLELVAIFLVVITTSVFLRRNKLRREGKVGPIEGQENFYYTI